MLLAFENLSPNDLLPVVCEFLEYYGGGFLKQEFGYVHSLQIPFRAQLCPQRRLGFRVLRNGREETLEGLAEPTK